MNSLDALLFIYLCLFDLIRSSLFPQSELTEPSSWSLQKMYSPLPCMSMYLLEVSLLLYTLSEKFRCSKPHFPKFKSIPPTTSTTSRVRYNIQPQGALYMSCPLMVSIYPLPLSFPFVLEKV